MDLARLQSELPWTEVFTEDFKKNPEAIKHFRHALDHIEMSLGKLRSLMHELEHGVTRDGIIINPVPQKYSRALVEGELSKLVCFAARAAQTWPHGEVNLAEGVEFELQIRKRNHEATG